MRCDLRPGRWQTALADVGEVDLLCSDPPFSARTHDGHSATVGGHRGAGHDLAPRKAISYPHWTAEDVIAFVAHWAPRTHGWFIAITSHDLAAVWETALTAAGRLVFAPLPLVEIGSRVRLSGDGPSSWTCWVIVGRPRGEPWSTWGTLPGAYICTREAKPHIGGKPVSLMRAIVRDYSRPGDLVCDPCAGGGTTAIAALQEGRRFVGAECDLATHHKAIVRLSQTNLAPPLLQEPRAVQASMFPAAGAPDHEDVTP